MKIVKGVETDGNSPQKSPSKSPVSFGIIPNASGHNLRAASKTPAARENDALIVALRADLSPENDPDIRRNLVHVAVMLAASASIRQTLRSEFAGRSKEIPAALFDEWVKESEP